MHCLWFKVCVLQGGGKINNAIAEKLQAHN
jgi:hypothetical protein